MPVAVLIVISATIIADFTSYIDQSPWRNRKKSWQSLERRRHHSAIHSQLRVGRLVSFRFVLIFIQFEYREIKTEIEIVVTGEPQCEY